MCPNDITAIFKVICIEQEWIDMRTNMYKFVKLAQNVMMF